MSQSPLQTVQTVDNVLAKPERPFIFDRYINYGASHEDGNYVQYIDGSFENMTLLKN